MSETGSILRVVTWNIELGKNVDSAAELLTTQPDLRDADLILVQEMSPASIDRLSQLLELPALYSSPANHPKTKEPIGNAVLSPWPMREPEQLLLPYTAVWAGLARSAQFVVATINDVDILVGSVHIEIVLLALKRRALQVASVADHASQNSMPSVVGGDFNSASARSRRVFTDAMMNAGLQRMSPDNEPTFKRFSRPFALDHVFGRGMRGLDTGVVSGAQASDHDPVWVEAMLTGHHELQA
jgi:endonuclease/exonuclease/phosphatase family metal-dependent hydrolase